MPPKAAMRGFWGNLTKLKELRPPKFWATAHEQLRNKQPTNTPTILDTTVKLVNIFELKNMVACE